MKTGWLGEKERKDQEQEDKREKEEENDDRAEEVDEEEEEEMGLLPSPPLSWMIWTRTSSSSVSAFVANLAL